MKTTVKKVETTEKEVKKEMKDLGILWEHKAESDVIYLSGNLSEELHYKKILAFYNYSKKNEKEPDVRVYLLDDDGKKDHEIISLWKQVSKQGANYYSGLTDEKENVVAFINTSEDIKQPKIRIYFK